VEKMASVVEARPEELEVIAHDLFARFMAEPLGSMGQRSATARKLFDQFAELSKKHREEPVISYFYGRMLDLMGDTERALKMMRKTLRLERDYRDAVTWKRQLEVKLAKENKRPTTWNKMKGLFSKD